MPRRWSISLLRLEIAFGVLLIVIVTFFLKWEFAVDRYEDVAYALSPSGARAFAYGERHFSASDAGAYDIDRAEYFFLAAAAQDSKLPYVYHELARIYFLKGDFPTALELIDAQITLHGDATPNSYYIRGLIEGYMGDYAAAAKDYKHFLQFDPQDWAAMNDYAWVLLKGKRFQNAADVTQKGLMLFPGNPWLLNSEATAFYELGHYSQASAAVQRASAAVASISQSEWLRAYPGNDPKIADVGIASFKAAVAENMHTIQLALASSTVQ